MVAFLGMGLLGSNFTKALRRRGEAVTVWNRNPARAQALAEVGAAVAATPALAAKGAARLHLTLKDDSSVDEVLDAAAPGFAPGLVIVDHTTTSVAGARRRAADWAAHGFAYLHAPVFMGPQAALEGTGVMLASGDRALFEKVEAAVAPMTGALKWVGADTGKAAALKLVGNALFLTLTAGLGDVLTLAKAMGLATADVTTLFSDLNSGAQLPARYQRILTADHSQPSWELAMARKDAGLMVAEAAAGGQVLTVLPALEVLMDRWIAAGHGADDWTVFTRDVR